VKITSEVEENSLELRYSDLEEDILYQVTSEHYRGYVVTVTSYHMYSVYPRLESWSNLTGNSDFRFRRLPSGFKVTIEQE